LNTQGTAEAYGQPTEDGYFAKLADAFTATLVRFSFRHQAFTLLLI